MSDKETKIAEASKKSAEQKGTNTLAEEVAILLEWLGVFPGGVNRLIQNYVATPFSWDPRHKSETLELDDTLSVCKPIFKTSKGPGGNYGLVLAQADLRAGLHTWSIQVKGNPDYLYTGIILPVDEKGNSAEHKFESVNNTEASQYCVFFMYTGQLRGLIVSPDKFRSGSTLKDNDKIVVQYNGDNGHIEFAVHGKDGGRSHYVGPVETFLKGRPVRPFASLGNSGMTVGIDEHKPI